MEPIIVNLGDLSHTLALTDKRRINQLVQDKVLSKTGHGKFDLVECVRAYIAYLRSRGGVEGDDPNDPRIATTRLKNAQALKYELENDLRQRELLEQAEVLQYLEELIVQLTMSFDAFEGRLAGSLAELTGTEKQRIADAIGKEVHAARTDAANALRALGDQWAARAANAAAADGSAVAVR